MHTHVVEGNSFAEFKQGVKDLYDSHFGPTGTVSVQPPGAPSASGAIAAPAQPAQTAAKRGPKGKAEKEEEKVAPEMKAAIEVCDKILGENEAAPVEIDPFAEETAPAVTIESVKEALMKVKTTVSMAAATGLFKKYGADRVSQLKVEDFPAIIADCDKLLGK